MELGTIKYALVTGAASGMGRIYALRLHAMGYGVIAVDINGQALEALAHDIQSDGGTPPVTSPRSPLNEFLPVCIDLSRTDAAAQIAAVTADLPVEILINNAGMISVAPTTEIPSARLSAMMGLHCTTPLLLCREFIPRMQAAGCGYVLNISSICAWMDWPLIGMYGNTKRFVKGYSRSLRVECAGSGVSVTTAFFGAVDTPLFGFPDKAVRWMKRLGVMISPDKAVDRALAAMFRRRRRVVPGLGNKLAIPLLPLVPDSLLRAAVRKFGKHFSRRHAGNRIHHRGDRV